MSRSRELLVGGLLALLAVVAWSLPAHAGLIGHWTFDEGTGSVAHDSSPSHFDGNLVGGASWVSGHIGGAIQLHEATSDLVNMGNVLALPWTSDWSISAWVMTEDSGESTAVVSKHVSGVVSGYFLGMNTSSGVYGQAGKAWVYNQAPSSTPYSTTTVNNAAWHHIVGVHDGDGNTGIYVDGIPVEAFAATMSTDSGGNGDFLIGGYNYNYSGGHWATYTGLVDEVRVYSHVLSDPEIQALFEGSGDIPEPATLSLAALAGLGLLARRRKA